VPACDYLLHPRSVAVSAPAERSSGRGGGSAGGVATDPCSGDHTSRLTVRLTQADVVLPDPHWLFTPRSLLFVYRGSDLADTGCAGRRLLRVSRTARRRSLDRRARPQPGHRQPDGGLPPWTRGCAFVAAETPNPVSSYFLRRLRLHVAASSMTSVTGRLGAPGGAAGP